MTTQTDDLACAEGEDIPAPLLVHLYGNEVAGCLAGKESVAATGRGCVKALAEKLLALGFDRDRELELLRGARLIGRTSIGAASQTGDEL